MCDNSVISTETFTYDAAGNVTDAPDSCFRYDTNCKLSKLLCKTTNGITTKYVYGLGLIGEEKRGCFKTYHFDCRGSTVAITNSDGNITDTFAYDTYGKLVSRTGSSFVIFGYNGRDGVITDKNGLIYMRARYYSPEMKRFVNADIVPGAISNAITLNRFAYANGNPVSLVDPFGLSVDTKDASKNTIANKIDGLFKKWKSMQRAKNFFKGTLSDIIQIPELYSVEAYYENVILKIPGDLELYYKITTTEGNGPISFNATDVLDLINQKTIKEQFTKLADMYPVEGGIKLPFPNNDEYVAQYLLAKAEFNTAKNSLTVTTAYNLNCSDDNGNAIDIEIGIKKDFDTDNKTHLEAYADAMDSIFYLMKDQNTDSQNNFHETFHEYLYAFDEVIETVFRSGVGYVVAAGFMAYAAGMGMKKETLSS